MNSKTIEQLQYFIGKVCTVLTKPVNRDFDELRAREHFVARINTITTDGIWGIHPHSDMVTFYQWEGVIGICEEIELDPNNPEHAQMIQEYEEKTGKKLDSDLTSQNETKEDTSPLSQEVPFVDISQLENLAAETKLRYDSSKPS